MRCRCWRDFCIAGAYFWCMFSSGVRTYTHVKSLVIQVKDLFPLCRTEDLLAGFYVKVSLPTHTYDVVDNQCLLHRSTTWRRSYSEHIHIKRVEHISMYSNFSLQDDGRVNPVDATMVRCTSISCSEKASSDMSVPSFQNFHRHFRKEQKCEGPSISKTCEYGPMRPRVSCLCIIFGFEYLVFCLFSGWSHRSNHK